LREREGDLSLLINHFLAVYNARMGKSVTQIEPEAMRVLETYTWPGNVRELESVLKQALINATGTVITKDCLPEVRCAENMGERGCSTLGIAEPLGEVAIDHLPRSDLAGFIERRLEAGSRSLHGDATAMMERYLLTRVLRETGGNQSEAAKILGITRGSLRNKIRALRLSIDQVVTVADGEAEAPVP
jgi:two-component system nitrogen regulation response regulator GlnG